MRDIRSDLEERAKLIEAEATRVATRFENRSSRCDASTMPT
jgi:hypothetical protein